MLELVQKQGDISQSVASEQSDEVIGSAVQMNSEPDI